MVREGDSLHKYKGRHGGKLEFFFEKGTGKIFLKPIGAKGFGEFTGYYMHNL